jgi:hypothetical protein
MRAFVRGDVGADELTKFGVRIAISDSGCIVDEPKDLPVVAPSIRDLATGLLVHWARSTGLRDWARIVLAASFVDLGALEDSLEGAEMLEVLWNAADGSPLNDAELERLRSIVGIAPRPRSE